MTAKLNQIIAIEKGIKSRVYSEISDLHKINQKEELFTGFQKTYQKNSEEGEDLPPEKKKVQYSAEEVLAKLAKLDTEIMEVTARKDYTNCKAVADIKIGEDILLKSVPVTYLLFLEKQITDIRTFINNMPVLDVSESWSKDENSGLYKSEVVKTHRTKKQIKPLVLYPATDKHPAQTQLVTEDVIAGYWQAEKWSGALQAPRKQLLMERVEELLKAVKTAREEANNIDEITPPDVGEAIFTFIVGKE